MEIKRRKFQGVLNILSFNRHFYLIGIAVLGLLLFIHTLVEASAFFYWVSVAAFLYGILMPLFVSAYVYDFSGYYKFDWLERVGICDSENTILLNINAGFDETSFSINAVFPKSRLCVFDFYDSAQHTEPAIVRARKVSQVYPDTRQISTQYIPMEDTSVDAIFLLSAAHEIRSQEERLRFLKECCRICKPGAKVVMVEHLRDFPNFLAFTVGFTHFFSRNTWMKAFESAGFIITNEKKLTPFMRIFEYSPLLSK